MQLMSLITNRFFFLFSVLCVSINLSAQENSPFSRYGIGDLYPDQSIASRAMGGLTSAFADAQVINTNNPASYANIVNPTFDLGISIDSRSLRDNSLSESNSSVNFSPSYITLGFPIQKSKKRRLPLMGFVLGLKPISRISYSVQNFSTFTQQTGIQDSLQNVYNGNGGLTQGFVGFGRRFGNLSIGFNAGLSFGKKDINTVVNIINDTIKYNQSNTEQNTAFWGKFLNVGFQYDIPLSKHTDKLTKNTSQYTLRLGGDVTFSQTLHANQYDSIMTFYYDANGAQVKIDSVYSQTNILGSIKLPTMYNAGFMLRKTISDGRYPYDKWEAGAQYEVGDWSQYLFYNTPDRTVNSWIARVGGQYTPENPATAKNPWRRAVYRIGFYTGQNYINADGNSLKEEAFTFGIGFRLIPPRTAYSHEYSLINTAIEIGKRGTSVNEVTENYFKFSAGFSLSDLWFIKRKYD